MRFSFAPVLQRKII